MKYTIVLVVGSLFLGLMATLLSGDLTATVNMGGKIGYGLGVAATPWVCAFLLASIKFIILRLAKRKISYGSVLKFDAGVFLALSYCMHLGFVSLPV